MEKNELKFSFLRYNVAYNLKIAKKQCFYQVCYGSAFSTIKKRCKGKYDERIHEVYEIFVHHYSKISADTAREFGNNVCLFSKAEIILFFADLKRLVEFDYRVDDHENGYAITLNINQVPMWHKIILTYSRYLYEHPYSFFTYDALFLRRTCFRNVNLINILNLVENSVKNICFSGTTHSLFGDECGTFMTRNTLEKAIKKLSKEEYWIRMNSFSYINKKKKKSKTFKISSNNPQFKELDNQRFESWAKFLKPRVKHYLVVIKEFK